MVRVEYLSRGKILRFRTRRGEWAQEAHKHDKKRRPRARARPHQARTEPEAHTPLDSNHGGKRAIAETTRTAAGASIRSSGARIVIPDSVLKIMAPCRD